MTNQHITHSDDLVRGEDQLIEFTVKDNDGAPVNITGWAVRWRLQKDGSAFVTKTVGEGITITAGTEGKLTVSIDAADTAALSPSREYFHDLWRTDSGSAQRLASGGVWLQ